MANGTAADREPWIGGILDAMRCVEGIECAVLSNYMWDIPFVFTQIPDLQTVPVLVLHGERRGKDGGAVGADRERRNEGVSGAHGAREEAGIFNHVYNNCRSVTTSPLSVTTSCLSSTGGWPIQPVRVYVGLK